MAEPRHLCERMSNDGKTLNELLLMTPTEIAEFFDELKRKETSRYSPHYSDICSPAVPRHDTANVYTCNSVEETTAASSLSATSSVVSTSIFHLLDNPVPSIPSHFSFTPPKLQKHNVDELSAIPLPTPSTSHGQVDEPETSSSVGIPQPFKALNTEKEESESDEDDDEDDDEDEDESDGDTKEDEGDEGDGDAKEEEDEDEGDGDEGDGEDEGDGDAKEDEADDGKEEEEEEDEGDDEDEDDDGVTKEDEDYANEEEETEEAAEAAAPLNIALDLVTRRTPSPMHSDVDGEVAAVLNGTLAVVERRTNLATNSDIQEINAESRNVYTMATSPATSSIDLSLRISHILEDLDSSPANSLATLPATCEGEDVVDGDGSETLIPAGTMVDSDGAEAEPANNLEAAAADGEGEGDRTETEIKADDKKGRKRKITGKAASTLATTIKKKKRKTTVDGDSIPDEPVAQRISYAPQRLPNFQKLARRHKIGGKNWRQLSVRKIFYADSACVRRHDEFERRVKEVEKLQQKKGKGKGRKRKEKKEKKVEPLHGEEMCDKIPSEYIYYQAWQRFLEKKDINIKSAEKKNLWVPKESGYRDHVVCQACGGNICVQIGKSKTSSGSQYPRHLRDSCTALAMNVRFHIDKTLKYFIRTLKTNEISTLELLEELFDSDELMKELPSLITNQTGEFAILSTAMMQDCSDFLEIYFKLFAAREDRGSFAEIQARLSPSN